jgi:ABC-type amino acid transport substrate-binding protein
MKKTQKWTALGILLLSLVVLTTMVLGCGSKATTETTAAGTETTAAAGTDTTAVSASAAAADAAVAAVTKSAAIETPQTIKAGKLQAGSDTTFPPMEFSDGKGGYIGFDVDLCTAIAKKMGIELQVVSTGWDGIIPGLLAGRYDIIMSAMSITDERLAQMNATKPYMPGILAISARKDAPITEAAGLAGKVVGVQVNTTGQTAVEAVAGVKEIKKYATILEAFMDLDAGRVEAVVNDEPVNLWIIETNPDYKAKYANTGGIVTDNSYGYWSNKQSTDLRDAMNTALTELIDEGVYQKICDKWGLTGVK